MKRELGNSVLKASLPPTFHQIPEVLRFQKKMSVSFLCLSCFILYSLRYLYIYRGENIILELKICLFILKSEKHSGLMWTGNLRKKHVYWRIWQVTRGEQSLCLRYLVIFVCYFIFFHIYILYKKIFI